MGAAAEDLSHRATELVAMLERNARFYATESVALNAEGSRRDRRQLGAKEAATIAQLLRRAADAIIASQKWDTGAGPG
jgi:hypothetical protein